MKISSHIITLIIGMLLSLSVVGQSNCFELIHSDSKVNWSGDILLGEKACKLRSEIGLNDFKILGADLYPIQAYVNEAEGFERSFNIIKSGQNHPSGHILFSRETRSDGTIEYRLDIDYPAPHVVFDTWDGVYKDAVKNVLLEELRENGTIFSSSRGEEKAIDRFIYIMEDGLESVKFESAGFTKVTLASESDVTRGAPSTNQVHSNLTIHNFDGHRIDGQEIGQIFAGVTQTGRISNFDFSIYVTGKEIEDDFSQFESIQNQFKSDPGKIKIWMHFDFTTEQIIALKDQDSSAVNKALKTNDRTLYILTGNNLTNAESEAEVDARYEESIELSTSHDVNEEMNPVPSLTSCGLDWQFGKKCIYNNSRDLLEGYIGSEYFTTQAAFAAGLLDGFLGTLHFFLSTSALLSDPNNLTDYLIVSASPVSIIHVILSRSLGFESYLDQIVTSVTDPRAYAEKIQSGTKEIVESLTMTVSGVKSFSVDAMVAKIKILWSDAVKYVGREYNGSFLDIIAYGTGILAFEILLDVATAGLYTAVQGLRIGARGAIIARGLSKRIKNGKGIVKESKDMFAVAKKDGYYKFFKCRILKLGCFVKDTPVVMASNSYLQKGKNLALAANVPLIMAVPIQEVQLLDYAVANTRVNESYNLLATSDNELNTDLLNGDPYTSDQQKERDLYEIDDENWNEVVFEEVYGGSTAKLALRNDWINQKGYQVDEVVNLDLTEQGISGPFRIASIKHILPQKRPEDDLGEAYGYRPVTALITHEASQVYNISFDNREQLGVTFYHPFYSTTIGSWKLAGELEVGEQVLTMSGNARVTSLAKKEGSEIVYNLEVKDLHNFLVGNSAIVVHNNCKKIVYKADDIADMERGARNAGATEVGALKMGKEVGDAGIRDALAKGGPLSWKELRILWDKARRFENLHAFDVITDLYNRKYGQRVTLSVANIVDGKVITKEIVPDFLVKDGNDLFKIVDAKFTTKLADDFTVRASLTKNQRIVFDWIKAGGNDLVITVRANTEKLLGLGIDTGDEIVISGIDIIKSKADDITESSTLSYY